MPVKLPYNEYLSIYGKVPRLCLDLIIKHNDGILLILRDIDPGKGLWHFPGGTLLMGESIDQAMVRIAQDETGLRVFKPKFLGFLEFVEAENLFYHTISLVYELSVEKGIPRGSIQGKELKYFKVIPDAMIMEQRKFILCNDIL